MEALARLFGEYHDRGFAVMIVPVDPKVTASEMETILDRDFHFPNVDHFLWCLDPKGTTVLKLDPTGVGGTIIIDRQGRVAFEGRMTHTYEEIKDALEKVL